MCTCIRQCVGSPARHACRLGGRAGMCGCTSLCGSQLGHTQACRSQLETLSNVFFLFWSKCTRNKVLCNIKSTSQKKEGGMEILLSLLEEGTTEDTVWLLPQGYFILGREGNREVWALFLFSRKLSPGRLLSANILVVVKTFKPSVRPEAKSKNNTMELCNKILVICPKCKFLSYYKCVRGFQG